MADVVIFGAGQIAAVAKAYIDAHGPDRVVGFTVDEAYMVGDSFEGLPVVAWDRLETHFPPTTVRLLGPLSYRLLNEFRRDRYEEGKRRGYTFASFVHPSAFLYTADIGENAFILELNVLQPFVRIGCGVMMWSGNHIGHHTSIGDFCFLSSQIGIGSNVHVGDRCLIGGKVGISSGVTIGDASILREGAMAAVDVPAEGVVAGPRFRLERYTSARLKRRL